MNIQEFKTSKGEFLGVLVPEDTESWINPYLPTFLHVGHIHGDAFSIQLPKGFEYKIIGIQTEMTEEQAKEVVEEQPYYDPTEPLCPIPFYKNYGLGHYKQTALESFNSLMQKLEIKPDTKTLIIQKIK